MQSGGYLNFNRGDYVIYIHYVIFGQLILAKNSPDLDNYHFKENEVILYVPLYNTENGYFRSVKKWLVYIMIWEDTDDTFLSYSYNKERSKVLYSFCKHPLPNVFPATAFKKRAKMFIEERSGEYFSPLFFFLPSTTNHKKKINNFFGSAHLHPIDFAYQEVSNYSVKSHTFYPKHLDSRFPEERSSKRNCF